MYISENKALPPTPPFSIKSSKCYAFLAILSKFWAGKYSSEIFGFNKNEGNIVGAGMVSRGEVALIVAQIGINHHLFPEDIYSSLILVIIVTTVISPFILNYFIKKSQNSTEFM